jgi:hypothetical protein
MSSSSRCPLPVLAIAVPGPNWLSRFVSAGSGTSGR